WVFETGSVGKPVLASATTHLWDISRPESVAFGLHIDQDANDLASLAWATGGREDDTVVVSRSYDPALIDAGYPLLETSDTSHSSVSRQATLDGHTAALLDSRPFETWSLVVK